MSVCFFFIFAHRSHFDIPRKVGYVMFLLITLKLCASLTVICVVFYWDQLPIAITLQPPHFSVLDAGVKGPIPCDVPMLYLFCAWLLPFWILGLLFCVLYPWVSLLVHGKCGFPSRLWHLYLGIFHFCRAIVCLSLVCWSLCRNEHIPARNIQKYFPQQTGLKCLRMWQPLLWIRGTCWYWASFC